MSAVRRVGVTYIFQVTNYESGVGDIPWRRMFPFPCEAFSNYNCWCLDSAQNKRKCSTWPITALNKFTQFGSV